MNGYFFNHIKMEDVAYANVFSVISTCPYCDKEFTHLRYGFDIECTNCKKLVNIYPDPEIWLHTKFGVIGVSGVSQIKNLLIRLIEE